ncbi:MULTISPECIES: hypothetical protein [unclassified Rhizobium]|uniref:hypothetical protein n=1 Tax=unclassified Rhizobium TaxID=2613769 RepID=UPI00161BE0C9|nr:MULTISPECIES: hypothetical protein [unclassified Rhizobium]MBB3521024.1 hypothetical protein [Rhizobium sp. BK456]MDR6664054.1 hypothetical protein [Rhizobium sp. 1399]
MGITVYAYAVDPAASTVTGFGNSIEEVAKELREVRAEIELEDGYEVPTSEVYAYDLYRPDLDQLLSVLSGDADLGDLILKNKRVVATVCKDPA